MSELFRQIFPFWDVPFWGTKCRYCEAGWRTTMWTRYDGYGRCRMHVRGHFPDDESAFCASQTWFSRHPFLTVLYLFLVGEAVFLALMLTRVIK